MEVVFWASVGFVLYVYAGYPLLLAVCTRLRRLAGGARYASRPGLVKPAGPGAATPGALPRASTSSAALPGVSVIIAARNEAGRLPARIDNLLASDYPADRLEIIVASDGSTDDTMAVLAPYRQRVTLLMLPAAGKAAALNAAVMHATNPLLVFADARQQFAPDAIRRLIAHFADRAVGAVSGELVLDCEHADVAASRSTIGDGVGAYWKYEKWLRRHESLVDSAVGVTGAIYAMRRWLWQPLPADAILDDVLGPMRLVQRGYRVTFEPLARAFDRASGNAPAEMRRKVRTLAGNFQLLRYEPRLVVPGCNRVWLQFVSHKLGRLFVPHALIAILVSSVYLATTGVLYAGALLAQLLFYGLAMYGAILDRRARVTPAAVEAVREAA
jgi:cellulose synthase/poly-beta-1,6-N-acetylglucosamine synthase-like glycosyltransferase